MKFNRRLLTTIQKALINRSDRIKVNQIWKSVHNELNVGDIDAGYIELSAYDLRTIRDWFIAHEGIDLLTDSLDGDRIQLASLSRDEKLSSDNVFENMIRVNCQSGIIPLHNGNVSTVEKTLLQVNANQIRLEDLLCAVIIENGAAAINWHAYNKPSAARNAVVVYRGHGSEVKYVKNWIDSLEDSVVKIGFFDFDPAGIGMALDYNVDYILVPDQLNSDLVSGKNNKPEHFDSQIVKRSNLENELPESLKEIWKWMSQSDIKCAITQEKMLALNLTLRLLDIRN